MVINYPNGQSLTSTALTHSQIEEILQVLVATMIGINPGVVTTGTVTAGQRTVALTSAAGLAVGQQVIGAGIPSGTTIQSLSGQTVTLTAPATATRMELIAFGADVNAFSAVRIGWQSEGEPAWGIADDVTTVTARISDEGYNRIRNVSRSANDATTLRETTTYTRIWDIGFSIYGPNSLDNARAIKSALFLDWTHDILAASNMYLVTDVKDAIRAPELFQGQWWERVDFDIRLNEGISESILQNTIASAEVVLETGRGVVADLTVL